VLEVRQILDRDAPGIKLIVGGAPFRQDPNLAARLGADAWAPDALQAVGVIQSLADRP